MASTSPKRKSKLQNMRKLLCTQDPEAAREAALKHHLLASSDDLPLEWSTSTTSTDQSSYKMIQDENHETGSAVNKRIETSLPSNKSDGFGAEMEAAWLQGMMKMRSSDKLTEGDEKASHKNTERREQKPAVPKQERKASNELDQATANSWKPFQTDEEEKKEDDEMLSTPIPLPATRKQQREKKKRETPKRDLSQGERSAKRQPRPLQRTPQQADATEGPGRQRGKQQREKSKRDLSQGERSAKHQPRPEQRTPQAPGATEEAELSPEQLAVAMGQAFHILRRDESISPVPFQDDTGVSFHSLPEPEPVPQESRAPERQKLFPRRLSSLRGFRKEEEIATRESLEPLPSFESEPPAVSKPRSPQERQKPFPRKLSSFHRFEKEKEDGKSPSPEPTKESDDSTSVNKFRQLEALQPNMNEIEKEEEGCEVLLTSHSPVSTKKRFPRFKSPRRMRKKSTKKYSIQMLILPIEEETGDRYYTDDAQEEEQLDEVEHSRRQCPSPEPEASVDRYSSIAETYDGVYADTVSRSRSKFRGDDDPFFTNSKATDWSGEEQDGTPSTKSVSQSDSEFEKLQAVKSMDSLDQLMNEIDLKHEKLEKENDDWGHPKDQKSHKRQDSKGRVFRVDSEDIIRLSREDELLARCSPF